MKLLAIVVLATIVLAFYLAGGGRQEAKWDQPTTQGEVRYPNTDDDTDKTDDEPRGASWQNQRAEKIIPLGSHIDQ